ncbi:MAG: phosphatidylserine decarboxylase [Gammaproteobacteria bacterium]|nr:MAG: phosphatidylserine decarboxylase [Gammaproteobacteria bacterium]
MSDFLSKENLAVLPQYLVPQHGLSRLAGLLADSSSPAIKGPFIKNFARVYGVNMGEALNADLDSYASFNDFFTRELKEGARTITDQGIASPADGAVSQLGHIKDDQIFQAKGHHYSLTQLLGGSHERALPFKNGSFATVYLSPRDYHRVHMPYGGKLTEMVYVPGKLFSVNTRTARHVPGLFARNERVVCMFDTDIGPMALVLVGAMIVASVETVWAGLVAPPVRRLTTIRYNNQSAPVVLQRGEEMGRFRLGSTAIVVFPKNTVKWHPDLKEASVVRMGQQIASQC